MTAVIRRKTWEERRADKIEREYVRLSEENRQLKADYLAALEQLQEVQIQLQLAKEVRS